MNFGWTPREKKLAILLAIVLICLGSMIIYSRINDEQALILPPDDDSVQQEEKGSSSDIKTQEETKETEAVWIDLQGAVQRPGVYQLAPGSRMHEAVQLAGGLLPVAERRAVNLAQSIRDGEVIYIPRKDEWDEEAWKQSITQQMERKDSGQDTITISINKATAEELTSLPGIGEAKASAILSYREKNGPFLSKEEIMEVSGIGEKLFGRMKDLISLD